MSATLQHDLTQHDLTGDAAPFAVQAPVEQLAPVVFASAHSGRAYTSDFIAESRLDPATLRRSEDSFVDELYGAAPALGAPLLTASFPRAWCDANREPWELDPAMFADRLPAFCNTASGRVRAGFGTIARIVADGAPIYRRKLLFAEAEDRIQTCWKPYHAALSQLIESTRARFGACLVIDCHSMPTERTAGRAPVSFVLGDAHGASCGPRVVGHVEDWLRRRGHDARRNDPYAGGYVTRHYGRPDRGTHVLQIEISRSLYMVEALHRRRPAFAEIREEITALAADLVVHAARLCAV